MTDGFLIDTEKFVEDAQVWQEWGEQISSSASAVPTDIDPAAFSLMQGAWADLRGTYLEVAEEIRSSLDAGDASFGAIAQRIKVIADLYRAAEEEIVAKMEQLAEVGK